MSKKRINKFTNNKNINHRLVFNKGMLSDDTEHTLMIAESLLLHSDSIDLFAKSFSNKLKLWFMSLPAGIGFATLRSILKLCLGFSYKKSGVFSAGNGPAMRSGIIGAFFYNDTEKINEFVSRSTSITHTDPKANIGAKAIAHIVSYCFKNKKNDSPKINEIFTILENVNDINDVEWNKIVNKLQNAYNEKKTIDEVQELFNLENGISGYIYHTIPMAIYAWLYHWGDYEKTITSLVKCGGDTDTVCAIAGALSGALVGEKGIPKKWIENIIECPKGIKYIKKIGNEISKKIKNENYNNHIIYFWPGSILRNLIFLIVLLFHGFRRLFPPY